MAVVQENLLEERAVEPGVVRYYDRIAPQDALHLGLVHALAAHHLVRDAGELADFRRDLEARVVELVQHLVYAAQAARVVHAAAYNGEFKHFRVRPEPGGLSVQYGYPPHRLAGALEPSRDGLFVKRQAFQDSVVFRPLRHLVRVGACIRPLVSRRGGSHTSCVRLAVQNGCGGTARLAGRENEVKPPHHVPASGRRAG